LQHGMVYEAEPPYTVLQTHAVSRDEMQRFTRLARYWDLVANSGRFARTLPVLMQGTSPFWAFMAFSDWLWQTTGQTSGLTPEALVDALFDYLTPTLATACAALPPEGANSPWGGPAGNLIRECGHDVEQVRQTLLADYLASGARARPACLREVLPAQAAPLPRQKRALSERQDRHAPAHPTKITA
jgi:hypothetical protein